jgi:hypothetical protein
MKNLLNSIKNSIENNNISNPPKQINIKNNYIINKSMDSIKKNSKNNNLINNNNSNIEKESLIIENNDNKSDILFENKNIKEISIEKKIKISKFVSKEEEETIKKKNILKKLYLIRSNSSLDFEEEKLKNSNINYSDEDLNEMKFEDAIINDKRTFIHSYWSVLKYSQILIFTFYTSDDYNDRLLKISLFFNSLALFITINSLFFNDSSMSHVYHEKGKFEFIYEIPKIILSSIITFVIEFTMSFFA